MFMVSHLYALYDTIIVLCVVKFAFFAAVNNYQCGGDMWYDVFRRSLIGMVFAISTLLGYLLMQIDIFTGPFICVLPLPIFVYYFYKYTEGKFRAKTQSLSLDFAKRIDNRNRELKEQNRPVPHDSFDPKTFRQPALWEPSLYPEPHRKDRSKEVADPESQPQVRGRKGSLSINPLLEVDDVLEGESELVEYFEGVVQRMAEKSPLPKSLIDKINENTEHLKSPPQVTPAPISKKQSMRRKSGGPSTFNPIHTSTQGSDPSPTPAEITGEAVISDEIHVAVDESWISIATEVSEDHADVELDEFQLFSRKKLDFAADDRREQERMTPVFDDGDIADVQATIEGDSIQTEIEPHIVDTPTLSSTNVPFAHREVLRRDDGDIVHEFVVLPSQADEQNAEEN